MTVSNRRKDFLHDRLPIKLIMPKQGTERRVPGGGAPPKPFREVDDQYRSRLSNQVTAIQESILPQLRKVKIAPVRVKLIPRAAAKSHRPDSIFSRKSCPIIGSGGPGELFVKVSPSGLIKLKEMIEANTSEGIIKELSCIESIEAITPALRRRGLSSEEILCNSPRRKHGFITRVKLFNFDENEEQDVLVSEFIHVCKERGIGLDSRGYSLSSWTFAAECTSVNDIQFLSQIIAVRSISYMPLVRTIKPKSLDHESMPDLPTRDSANTDIPVVVVVDSGITDKIASLNTWVVGRDKYVPKNYQNTYHGTFVAGLVCWGSELNPTLSGLESGPCGVFDLQVIPNCDPEVGDTLNLLESELLISLEMALKEHSNKYKVWNLSLGTNLVCSLDEFSDLAVQLDDLQERYQVSFVISAGNYDTPPLLDFPRVQPQIELGRITSPADSVLGITVGAISHVNFNSSGLKMHYPSSFSRHGAGPNYIIKPDLVHYGGSCSTDLRHIHGIKSLSDKGLIEEDLGTSFATPLVSRTLAQIYHQITPTPSPVLTRALLTHHASDPRSGKRVPDGEENYLGFGLPSPVLQNLGCTPYTATLIFEDRLRPGYFLEWDDFPYPPSLKKGDRYFGEIWMTLAFSPSRGNRWGSEYCETHINAHFGVYRNKVSRNTGEIKTEFKGLVPPEHRNPSLLYEAYQIEKLRKWAPVRTYFGDMGEKGERGLRWRLKLQLLTRHGVEADNSTLKPQSFSLIITIADPNKKAPVYDEMAQIVRNRFQAQNLAVRARSQIRGSQQ